MCSSDLAGLECGAGIRGWQQDLRWLRMDARPAVGGGVSHRRQAADFEQLEAERLDLREHAMKRRAVAQRPGQHGVAAAGPGLQGGECAAYRLAQAAADPDAVPVRRRVVGCAGHLLTARRGEAPAGGGTVVGACMLIPPDRADPHP